MDKQVQLLCDLAKFRIELEPLLHTVASFPAQPKKHDRLPHLLRLAQLAALASGGTDTLPVPTGCAPASRGAQRPSDIWENSAGVSVRKEATGKKEGGTLVGNGVEDEYEVPAVIVGAYNDLPSYTVVLNGVKKWARWRKVASAPRTSRRSLVGRAVSKVSSQADRQRQRQPKRQPVARPSAKFTAWAGRRVDRIVDYVAPRPDPRHRQSYNEVNVSILRNLFASGTADSPDAVDGDGTATPGDGLAEEGFSLFAPSARP